MSQVTLFKVKSRTYPANKPNWFNNSNPVDKVDSITMPFLFNEYDKRTIARTEVGEPMNWRVESMDFTFSTNEQRVLSAGGKTIREFFQPDNSAYHAYWVQFRDAFNQVVFIGEIDTRTIDLNRTPGSNLIIFTAYAFDRMLKEYLTRMPSRRFNNWDNHTLVEALDNNTTAVSFPTKLRSDHTKLNWQPRINFNPNIITPLFDNWLGTAPVNITMYPNGKKTCWDVFSNLIKELGIGFRLLPPSQGIFTMNPNAQYFLLQYVFASQDNNEVEITNYRDLHEGILVSSKDNALIMYVKYEPLVAAGIGSAFYCGLYINQFTKFLNSYSEVNGSNPNQGNCITALKYQPDYYSIVELNAGIYKPQSLELNDMVEFLPESAGYKVSHSIGRCVCNEWTYLPGIGGNTYTGDTGWREIINNVVRHELAHLANNAVESCRFVAPYTSDMKYLSSVKFLNQHWYILKMVVESYYKRASFELVKK